MLYVIANHNIITSCNYMYSYLSTPGQTLFHILRLLPPFVVSIYIAILINNTYSCPVSDGKQYDSNVEINHSQTFKKKNMYKSNFKSQNICNQVRKFDITLLLVYYQHSS